MLEKGEVITTTVAAFFAGGGGVAVINYLLNRQKTDAETKQIQSLTEKEKIRVEIEMNAALIETLREVKKQYNEVSAELHEMRGKVQHLESENLLLKAQIGNCEHRLDKK
jgi:hypothetical protein